jgi:hypothetical protein
LTIVFGGLFDKGRVVAKSRSHRLVSLYEPPEFATGVQVLSGS